MYILVYFIYFTEMHGKYMTYIQDIGTQGTAKVVLRGKIEYIYFIYPFFIQSLKWGFH
jgi:hypothetical protein